MIEFLIPVAVVVFITIATRRMNARSGNGGTPRTPSPRAQRLIARIQAQQAQQGLQPSAPQGQYTQPAGGFGGPGAFGGQPPAQYAAPAPYSGPPPAVPYVQPGQFQPATAWYPPSPPQAQRAIQPKPSQRELDHRVRELMKTGHEVAAVRLLCDEQDLGIIDAQKRARSLIAPAGTTSSSDPDRDRGAVASDNDTSPERETRYVGSAAIAESMFDTNQDDKDSWASGWIDPPEPGDRSDIDELWKTVRDHGRERG